MSTFVWIPGGDAAHLQYFFLLFSCFFAYGTADVAQAGFGQG